MSYALLAVAVVALPTHHLFRNVLALVWGDEPDDGADVGVGLFVSVRDAHAATDANVKSCETAVVVYNGNEPKVVGKDVDIVLWWHGDRDLVL